MQPSMLSRNTLRRRTLTHRIPMPAAKPAALQASTPTRSTPTRGTPTPNTLMRSTLTLSTPTQRFVIASAGTVGTGAVDPINAIADICKKENLWLHIDGAYGAMAAALPDADSDLKAISRADSVALDPHKWLYSPLEAGCTLVRDAQALEDAFNFQPNYYKFDLDDEVPPTNFYGLGMQNSRGFRALKVWLAFKHVGANAFRESIREDIQLSRAMANAVNAHDELELVSQSLSIATFSFVPTDIVNASSDRLNYLNELNEALLERIQKDGRVFLSNAVVNDRFVLRACIVNFRTTLNDVQMLPGIVVDLGQELDRELRFKTSASETIQA